MWEKLTSEEVVMTNDTWKVKRGGEIHALRRAAIAGILILILYIPFLILSFLLGWASGLEEGLMFLYIFLLVAIFVSGLIFHWGFVITGGRYDNSLLTITSYLLIVMSTISFGSMVLLDFILPPAIAVVLSVITGMVLIPFGIGLLRLEPEFGSLTTGAGVLAIIMGASYLTVVLVFITAVLLFPLYILEVMLLFRAAERP